jgi:acetyl esterase/lipase
MRVKTDEEWKAFAMEKNLQCARVAKTLAATLGVTVKEDRIAGVNVHRVTPAEIDEHHQSHLFLFIHGGAWVLNAGLAGTTKAVVIAARLKIPVV